MKIIIDAMGGDNAPDAIALGAIEAAKEEKLDVVLVGRGEALKEYLEKIQEKSADAFIFPSSSSRSKSGRYGNSWIHAQFRQILRIAKIPYNGSGNGPRPHDIRHTFAVHCLNNWVLSGEDITAALPVLSRYLGHNGLSGTQKYLQLTAQMYPDIVTNLELQFGALIPQMEVANENI